MISIPFLVVDGKTDQGFQHSLHLPKTGEQAKDETPKCISKASDLSRVGAE